jgi:hypothetical protein
MVELHDQRPLQALVSSRSQTASPGVHGSAVTQFIVGSQYSPVGQLELSGVWTHMFVLASHVSVVQGTPSSHVSGLFDGTQNPPRHSTPLLPAHMFGAVQSAATVHVCIPPPSFEPPSPPVVPEVLLLLELLDRLVWVVWLVLDDPWPLSPPPPRWM